MKTKRQPSNQQRLAALSHTPRRSQQGVMLIEALMAMLIFMLGILGMVGVSAMAVNAQSDAQYRTDANALTNEIAQRIWLTADRTSTASLRASLLAFQHQPTEDTPCRFSGDKSDNAEVTDWVNTVLTGPARMGGADDTMQRIVVPDTADNFNRVEITVCWQTAGDIVPRRHTIVTLVN